MTNSHSFNTALVLIAAISIVLCACAEDGFESTVDGGGDSIKWDGGGYTPDPCKAGADADGDKIPDQKEGCNPARDTDGDKVPDYADTDSDGDGIPDSVEGQKDSDGDKRPDFQDSDSDGDGIKDGDEDLNGDGLLGCCLSTCGEKRKGCPPVAGNQCGLGQKCLPGGKCDPLVSFLCADGETSPQKKTTFSGGKADKELPTFICRKSGEMGQKGLKPMDFRVSSKGAWKVALEQNTPYGEVTISGAGAKEAAAAMDYKGQNQAVAGFVVSLDRSGGDIAVLSAGVINDIKSKLSGASAVAQLSSGNLRVSHDKFPTVVSTQLAVTLSAAKRPGAVRNALLAALLGKQVPKGGFDNYGPASTALVIRLQTLARKDRLLVMGGVGPAKMAADAKLPTAFHLEDLSNGTGLATTSDSGTVECDPFLLTKNPVADIIWVVDDSGSMSDNLADIVNNANDFFSRAVKSGLDFRMAVTGVADPWDFMPLMPPVKVGKFCGQLMPPDLFPPFSDGGPDRFLGSNEQAIFKSCVANPPYKEGSSEYGLAHALEGVRTHLPRTAGHKSRIRPNASLAIIIATDEAPKELKGGEYPKGVKGPSLKTSGCSLTSTSQLDVNSYLKTWLNLFAGKDPKWKAQGKAMVHLIGGICASGKTSSCSAEVGHGYLELVKATGGIAADICQKNLGSTLQIIIDTITGAASPAILQYVPISASLAVAVNTKQLARSRVSGFDYVGFSNSLVFTGVNIGKGSQVVASYRRWVRQATLK